MDGFFNKERPDNEIVTQWLNEFSYVQSGAEKLELFHKVQEYILRKSPELLPEFIDTILSYTMDPSTDIKKALVGFIEEACKVNEDMLPKVTMTLHMLLVDKSVPVQKKVIQVAISIYRKMLMWICKVNLITDEMEKSWINLTTIKTEIINLIDSDNDGIRTSAVKFLESIVLLQSYPDPDSKSTDFSLDDVPLTLKLARRRKLEEEAKNIFDILINFNVSSHISSANLFACVGALTNIGKNRPSYMEAIVENIDTLQANMPPTLSTMQVNSVRKKLKMELISLIKHSAAIDHIEQISKMLLSVGCTQQDVNKITPKVDEKRKAAKRLLKEQETAQQAKKAKLDDNVAEKQQQAIAANEEFIEENLNKNTAMQIVMKALCNVPENASKTFNADYLASKKIGATGEVKTIAKLLAPLFVEAGVGPGSKIIGKTTLVKETVEPEPEDTSDKMEVDETAEKEKQAKAIKERLKVQRIRTLKLNEVTKPLDKATKQTLLVGSIKRLLQSDKKINAPLRQKIITTVAASFSEGVRTSVLTHLLFDLKSNLDLALSWLYEEYSIMQGFLRVPELRKDGRIDQNYNTLLNSFVSTASSDAIMLSRLLLEAPLVTEAVLEQLCIICRDEHRCAWAMGLLRDLILRRPTRQTIYLNALLVHTTYELQSIRDAALNHTVDLFNKHEKYQDDIIKFITTYLDYLYMPSPPAVLFGYSQGRIEGSDMWSDDLVRACLQPYIAILAVKGHLIQYLAKVYVATSPDIKRMILKLLESPVKQMGMDHPHLLKLVEECPKGAETLITRVIQVLTDKSPPSDLLVQKVRDLYHAQVSDVRFLIPILNGLSKKEIIQILPKLIKLNPVVVREVFNRLLGAHGESSITPTELLVSLHLIDTSQADLKTTMKATSMCLQDKTIYTQEVLAVVLQQLMDHTPFPTLIMRTVIQALSSYPRLSGFVQNILQRLIVKQVWKQRVVWEGFIKCCQRTMPQSFTVLFQLPGPQLKEAINICGELKEPLKEHVLSLTESQRSHLPAMIVEMLLGTIPAPNVPEPVPAPIIPDIPSEPLPPGME